MPAVTMGMPASAAFGRRCRLRRPAGYHGRMSSPRFPDTAGELSLPGPAGRLQVVVDPPEAGVSPQPVIAIVCHPLPTEGGTLHNKVVTMAARALRGAQTDAGAAPQIPNRSDDESGRTSSGSAVSIA